jgi:predicted secreted protein
MPVTINGKTFVSRISSPLKYDKEGKDNPISQKEIFVPNITGKDMGAFFQIIGNLGGYANKEYFDDTNMILLSNETLRKLEQGIKDNVILDIEERYNKSNTKIFNVNNNIIFNPFFKFF